jgi:hypothetical protein
LCQDTNSYNSVCATKIREVKAILARKDAPIVDLEAFYKKLVSGEIRVFEIASALKAAIVSVDTFPPLSSKKSKSNKNSVIYYLAFN